MPPAAWAQLRRIVVAGDCDPALGWLVDYTDISQAFKPSGNSSITDT
jgi:hypothetical protein